MLEKVLTCADVSGCVQRPKEGHTATQRFRSVRTSAPSTFSRHSSLQVAKEVNKCFKALKQIVLMSINAGAHIPALSASLEYFKYTASIRLPTAFEEAQLDYFGGHSYDTVNEDVLNIKKGSHHTEWKKP